jgi:hypothetical protein
MEKYRQKQKNNRKQQDMLKKNGFKKIYRTNLNNEGYVKMTRNRISRELLRTVDCTVTAED